MALKSAGSRYPGIWINELKNGDISYYVNFRDENSIPRKILVGKNTSRIRFSLKDAQAKLIEIKYKMQYGEVPSFIQKRKSTITFHKLWENFYLYAQSNKKSYLMDKQNYYKHIEPIFGKRDIYKIKSLDITKFKLMLLHKGLQGQTVKHQLTLMRTIFNFAIKHETVSNFTNPISDGKVTMPTINNQRLAFLTKQQAKEILDILQAIHPTTYHLTILLLFTGARFSEITGAASQKNKTYSAAPLLWSDINFETNTIYLKETKNGNARYIAINPILLNTLEHLFASKVNDYVITNSAGGIILKMPDYFMRAVETVVPGNKNKEAKYKITAHSLRHTHASWLAMAELDILQIKEQMGHKNIEMTMRYAHLIPNKRYFATKAIHF